MSDFEEKNGVLEEESPCCNTGCMDTIESGLRACVDWVQVTLKNFYNLQQAVDLLRLPIERFISIHALV